MRSASVGVRCVSTPDLSEFLYLVNPRQPTTKSPPHPGTFDERFETETIGVVIGMSQQLKLYCALFRLMSRANFSRHAELISK